MKSVVPAFAAGLVLSAALLAGCNKPDEPLAAPTMEQPAAVTPPPAPAEPAPAPEPAPKPKPKPKPVQPPPPPPPQVCYDCGTVTTITPVTQKGEAGAMGTIGGAAAGGVIGHQFGGGKGKDAATIGGAILGAVAGREIEKRARSTTVYEIGVRMDDGSSRSVTVADPAGLSVGSAVRVEGNNLRPR
ncbi:MAG TPA: glycine zipper 2TM domain-containing protein [Solimonas sp.]|nr:glycine zipper 2TM domain-containing protein [Solimonas sp.]